MKIKGGEWKIERERKWERAKVGEKTEGGRR